MVALIVNRAHWLGPQDRLRFVTVRAISWTVLAGTPVTVKVPTVAVALEFTPEKVPPWRPMFVKAAVETDRRPLRRFMVVTVALVMLAVPSFNVKFPAEKEVEVRRAGEPM